ncbi:hypothetical protein BP5796_06918 [Coleophoma crateriformis]|uniref:Major facilitator superfamily (MFS) profile domain-containing protein n=1 Tax=Coleophoma crateriformis TaxID=565419 RepID=A0A3D8RPU4_9HELO|nr:hypothetical protein BP5796_06918 [Coleophoma crateriformis]
MATPTEKGETPLPTGVNEAEGNTVGNLSPTVESSFETESEKPHAHAPESIEDDGQVPHLHAKTYLTVFAVCLIYFTQLINVVGAGARTQDIEAVVGGSSNSVWVTSAISIGTVVLSPPVSQAADYWGRRWFLIVLTACGIVGSIIVARANSMGMVIAGETIAGLSYGVQPLLHAVASEVLPRKQRPFAQAAMNASAGMGGLVALLVGGALTRSNPAGFRNYWYFATALYAFATILCFVLYNPPPQKSQLEFTNAEKLAKLDWIGYLLLTAGLVLFCMGLSWAQNPYAWTDAHVLAPFLIGVALIFALGYYEWKIKKDGMFHHGLFRNGRNFPIALLCIFVEGLVFFTANNYFAFEAGVLFETDPVRTGLRYGITMICYAVFAIVGGFYCAKTKTIRLPTVTAFVFIIVFFVCMATVTPASSNPFWGYAVLLGVGLGVCLCALVTVAQLSTPKELIATTSGLMIGMRSLGGSVGLAIYNAIFVSKLSANLGAKIAAAVIPAGLPMSSLTEFITDLAASNTAALAKVPGVTPAIIGAGVGGLDQAYSIAFRYVWIAAGCFTVVACVGAAFLVDPAKEFNKFIDAPAEKVEDIYETLASHNAV